jgi:hypothetical protein
MSDTKNFPIETLIEVRNNVQNQLRLINTVKEIHRKLTDILTQNELNLLLPEYKGFDLHISQEDYTEELNKCINNINKVVYNQCHHNWIVDDIDIDPDRSIQIKYCEVCQMNFDKET